MINWGDYQQMPDYRQFIDPNKHKSAIAGMARALDPMTYIPGIQEVANPIHDLGEKGITAGNEVLSPVVKAAHQITDTITPGLKQLREQIPMMQNIHRFTENKPVDAAAIAAATYFTGGAASSLFSGAGAGAGAGAAGAGSLGAVGGSTAGALQGGVFSGLGAGGAGAAGTSLGAAGGAAAGALEGGTFSGLGAGTGTGLLGSIKAGLASAAPYIRPVLMAKDIASNLSAFAGPDVEKLGAQQQQMILAERIRNDQTNPELPNTPPEREKKKKMVIDAMMQQPQFFGRGY